MQVLVGFDSRGMITVFPKCPMPVVALGPPLGISKESVSYAGR
jgi:hypothetical protein